VDRFYKEMSLPQLDKTKFLVPQEITMSQFVTIIRCVTRLLSVKLHITKKRRYRGMALSHTRIAERRSRKSGGNVWPRVGSSDRLL
jgi:hypothetical protein